MKLLKPFEFIGGAWLVIGRVGLKASLIAFIIGLGVIACTVVGSTLGIFPNDLTLQIMETTGILFGGVFFSTLAWLCAPVVIYPYIILSNEPLLLGALIVLVIVWFTVKCVKKLTRR